MTANKAEKFACFVTGTDTDVGKTLMSCAMLYALAQQGVRAAGMKPVAAGAVQRDNAWHNDDTDALIAASTVKLVMELATPYLLRTAASPHIAAAAENLAIAPTYIAACLSTNCQPGRCGRGRRRWRISGPFGQELRHGRYGGTIRPAGGAGSWYATGLPQSCLADGRVDCSTRIETGGMDCQHD